MKYFLPGVVVIIVLLVVCFFRWITNDGTDMPPFDTYD